ncbi:DUF2470 domain-containing protein [Geodermatophilus sp. YIM 151500]|uniref:DUF2470 domain-containing protein n=1 Tax=Geodermatophilus sp. YIM 151500 TaxID=2984531 RepID=UPI0021E38C8B|nr:DUF2470 domain-containing protein [Geodermatophilus sp. YIM 151500]MCV2491148.1 DUF2470 domain-containing protein [Geodermatophilus sp. YIM 151500]
MTVGHSPETGDPRRALQPSAPDLARTVAARGAPTLQTGGPGSDRLLAATTTVAGQVLVVVPSRGDVAAAVRGASLGDVPARLAVTLYGPLPMRSPVRARLELTGWLAPVPAARRHDALLAFADVRADDVLLDVGLTATLLRLDLAEVAVEGCGRRVELSPEAFAAASPDPVATAEEEVLLAAAVPLDRLQHAVQLWAGAGETVHLLGVDSYGVTFRVLSGGISYDLRVPFPRRVDAAGDVPAAVHELTACPHLPG